MTYQEAQLAYGNNLKTKYITLHVSATKEGVDIGRDEIDRWHKNKGWSMIGYHYVIQLDGTIEIGRPESKMGSHVRGYNKNNIGVCIIGGLDSNLAPKDTRTDKQKESLECLLIRLKKKHPNATIKGHRDFSPDLNNNGIIEPFEFMKACPCFNAMEEYKHL